MSACTLGNLHIWSSTRSAMAWISSKEASWREKRSKLKTKNHLSTKIQILPQLLCSKEDILQLCFLPDIQVRQCLLYFSDFGLTWQLQGVGGGSDDRKNRDIIFSKIWDKKWVFNSSRKFGAQKKWKRILKTFFQKNSATKSLTRIFTSIIWWKKNSL